VATINKDQLDFLAGGDGTMRSGIGSGEAGLGWAGLGWHVFHYDSGWFLCYAAIKLYKSGRQCYYTSMARRGCLSGEDPNSVLQETTRSSSIFRSPTGKV
jgi:hypothetical protein